MRNLLESGLLPDCSMTKKEIVKAISDLLGLPQQQVKRIVQKLLESVIETLAEDGRVELRNFGVFEVKRRKPRHARNPKTGEQVPIPARSVVTFKPGKEMEARVLEVLARKARLAKLAELPADTAKRSEPSAPAPGSSPVSPPASPRTKPGGPTLGSGSSGPNAPSNIPPATDAPG